MQGGIGNNSTEYFQIDRDNFRSRYPEERTLVLTTKIKGGPRNKRPEEDSGANKPE